MGQEIATELARFALEKEYTDIPKEVIDFTKGLILKTVAGMVAGSGTPSGQKMARLIRERKLPEEVGVIGSGFKSSLWDTLLLNGFFAHAAELEDDSFDTPLGGVWWDITVIPPLITLAEKLRLSGEDLLKALVVGLEVCARTGLFINPPMGIGHVAGAVGPAVGAAKALGLGIKETVSAMGLALTGIGTTIVNMGTDAHYLESALLCLQGGIAAEMAKEGMTGNPDLGKYLSRFYGKEHVVPERMVENLGQEWLLTMIWIKKYPSCFATHRQIDSMIELRKKHNLSSADVESIEVHGGVGDHYVDRPDPKTEVESQFSVQHVVSVALVHGDVNFPYMTEDALNDPEVKRLRPKVKMVYHPEWPHGSLTAPARVVVKTKDGKEFSRERTYIIGSPKEPLTMEDFRGLYFKFTGGRLSEKDMRETADTILNLEKLHDVSELTNILTFKCKI